MRFPFSSWLLTLSSGIALSSGFTVVPVVTVAALGQMTTFSALRMTNNNKDDVVRRQEEERKVGPTTASSTSAVPTAMTSPSTPPPVLNGKMVLPVAVMQNGLAGHQIAAVYALIGGNNGSDGDGGYKRGTDGWKQVIKVGTTLDLWATLLKEGLQTQSTAITHVRALSFSFPQKNAMKDVAQQWKDSVMEAGGTLLLDQVDADETDDLLRRAQLNAVNTFDDDDDEFDDDDDIEMMIPPPPSGDVVSPFAEGALTTIGKDLPFTAESVNIVLDEVRPYLIADGGNVTVDRVDEETKNVYLKLEGACGSCASSTVTMQMGIERVLKENFADLGQVVQIDNGEEKPSELTMDMVMVEVNRIGPAIFAMGGQYELVNVDPLGVVELKFKGPNKLQQGLELALLDIPLCKHVKFTMFD